MQINKAIITAAGKTQSHLPLQTVVDRSGEVRTRTRLVTPMKSQELVLMK